MKEYGLVLENASLKELNTYKIECFAKYLVYVKDQESLVKLLKNIKLPYFILGGGSNIILKDEFFNGIVIKLDNLKKINYEDDYVEVESGVNLNSFINDLLKKGFVNLGLLFGIPGSVGGAIMGNAGCYGKSIFDELISVKIIDDGKIKEIEKENIKYGYRYSEFKEKNIVIISAKFRLEKGNVEEIRNQIKMNLEKRINSQPLEYPNAGSVFKNPEGFSAGKLIEEAGLKGLKIGGAMISEKHANFIINHDNAKALDIIELIKIVKNKIKEINNIDLELEQIVISEKSV
ncbi:MAG: UDP-N-acetylmuramate dehydrogenase [Firmicutes bacterium]|nr:UDP-N-acetylmuramate dehydrogenase [Bacillota bacterium]